MSALGKYQSGDAIFLLVIRNVSCVLSPHDLNRSVMGVEVLHTSNIETEQINAPILGQEATPVHTEQAQYAPRGVNRILDT
jgi:hypothetical protein